MWTSPQVPESNKSKLHHIQWEFCWWKLSKNFKIWLIINIINDKKNRDSYDRPIALDRCSLVINHPWYKRIKNKSCNTVCKNTSQPVRFVCTMVTEVDFSHFRHIPAACAWFTLWQCWLVSLLLHCLSSYSFLLTLWIKMCVFFVCRLLRLAVFS